MSLLLLLLLLLLVVVVVLVLLLNFCIALTPRHIGGLHNLVMYVVIVVCSFSTPLVVGYLSEVDGNISKLGIQT